MTTRGTEGGRTTYVRIFLIIFHSTTDDDCSLLIMLFWTRRNCGIEGTHPPQHLPHHDSPPPPSHETQRRSATSQETGVRFYNGCSYFIFILLLTTVVQKSTLRSTHPPWHLPHHDSPPTSSHEMQWRSQVCHITRDGCTILFFILLLLTNTVVQNNMLRGAHTLLVICHQHKTEGSTTTPLSHVPYHHAEGWTLSFFFNFCHLLITTIAEQPWQQKGRCTKYSCTFIISIISYFSPLASVCCFHIPDSTLAHWLGCLVFSCFSPPVA